MDNISDKRVRTKVFDKYKGRCAYCGCRLGERFSVDHIKPKLRHTRLRGREAGRDLIDNYNPSCFACNSSKSTLSLEVWRESIEHKIIQLNRDSATYRTAKRFNLVKQTNKQVVFYFEKFING